MKKQVNPIVALVVIIAAICAAGFIIMKLNEDKPLPEGPGVGRLGQTFDMGKDRGAPGGAPGGQPGRGPGSIPGGPPGGMPGGPGAKPGAPAPEGGKTEQKPAAPGTDAAKPGN